jgi:hypothetical protein
VKQWNVILELETSEIESASELEDELRSSLDKNEVAYSLHIVGDIAITELAPDATLDHNQ